MATISQVAAQAGVSVATVSRVLNGVRVADDLRDRVRLAIDDLNYTPSRTARSLRRQHSELIALVIPDIENPFFTSLARGAEDRAQASGYSLVLCNTDEDSKREAEYLRVAAAEHMAGVILAPAHASSDLSQAGRRPVVAVDRAPSGYDVDTVTADNHRLGEAATQALLARGRRRIACITGPADVETAQARADGWRDAIRAQTGSYPPAELLYHGDYRFEGGQLRMAELLSSPNPPDAVIVANNLMGVGALSALSDRTTAMTREDIAVIGGMPAWALGSSDVTVIPLPARSLGERAADLLIARIEGDASPRQYIVVQD